MVNEKIIFSLLLIGLFTIASFEPVLAFGWGSIKKAPKKAWNWAKDNKKEIACASSASAVAAGVLKATHNPQYAEYAFNLAYELCINY